MKKFVIVTDSCSDLDKALRERYSIDYIPMHMTLDGKDYPADLDWGDFSFEEFYKLLREGKRFTTAQINVAEYRAAFEKYVNDGYDVLSISCSSALSASVKESYIVRDELMAKYPDAKIVSSPKSFKGAYTYPFSATTFSMTSSMGGHFQNKPVTITFAFGFWSKIK